MGVSPWQVCVFFFSSAGKAASDGLAVLVQEVEIVGRVTTP